MAQVEPAVSAPADDVAEPAIGFFAQVAMMLRALWGARVRNMLLLLAAIMLAIILATAYVQVLLNRWNVPFYDALQRRDLDAFFTQLQQFAIIASLLLLLNVAQTWFNQLVGLKMRDGLTRDLVDQWLKPKRALRLSTMGILGVNPDQRLHEDASHLSEMTTSLTIGLVQATIMLASFVGVLWELSSGFVFTYRGDSFSIPGYMVWAAIVYAASASLLSAVVGRKLVTLNANRYSKEAELRASLMRSNENLTAIAVLKGEGAERKRIDLDIAAVLATMWRLALALTNLRWVSAGYGWLTVIAPILIAAPVYFAGGLTFGGLMMAVGAFNQVYASLRWYVDNFGAIADWKATLMRVANFRYALLQMDNETATEGDIRFEQSVDDSLTLRDIRISSEKGGDPSEAGFRLQEGELVVRPNDRVMINGDQSVNRHLLFRALAGWWSWGTGTIAAPPEGDILFLPQVGYLPYGTMREAVSFPQDAGTYSDEAIKAALDRVGLSHFREMLDTRLRWDKVLDHDGRTALGVATVLLRPPRWLVMEDTLEGLEPAAADHLAGVLAGLSQTALVYIGRSESFLKETRPRIFHLEALPSSPAVPG